MDDNKKVLVKRFKHNAELTTAIVQIIPNNETELSKTLLSITNSEKKVLIAVNDEDLISSYLKAISPIFEPNNNEISSIPICITDSVCGIAETGSVIVSAETGYAAYFTMLTQVQIVLLNSSDIYERPRDIFDGNHRKNGIGENFSIITGPSATADMGSLVRGVHGPEKLHIIILD